MTSQMKRRGVVLTPSEQRTVSGKVQLCQTNSKSFKSTKTQVTKIYNPKICEHIST